MKSMYYLRTLIFLCSLVIFLKNVNITQAASLTCGGWSLIASPNGGSSYNNLNSVAAISANDAWAVGSYENQGSYERTLIEQRNGTSWNLVFSPNVNASDSLHGVAAVSANNVWAVGFDDPPSFRGQTLTEFYC